MNREAANLDEPIIAGLLSNAVSEMWTLEFPEDAWQLSEVVKHAR